MIAFGILGLIIISFSVWDRKEARQDILFILGGICLLAYSAYLRDPVFIALQVVFIASAAFELIRLKRRK